MELEGLAYSLFLPKRELDELGPQAGQPLRVLTSWGNHQSNFARYRVAEGDTVVAIYLESGRLMVLARMVVGFKGLGRAWNLGNPGNAVVAADGRQVLVARAASEIVFDRPAPRELTDRWVFASSPPRGLPLGRDGTVRSTVSVEGMRRLSDATAERLCALDGMALIEL